MTQLKLTLPEALSAQEAANILGVSSKQVRRLVNRNRLTGAMFRGQWLIDLDSVLRYHQERGVCNRYGVKGGAAAARRGGKP